MLAPMTDKLPPAAEPFRAASFEGQVAFVTGGGTGLGLEISRGLAALGATVVVGSRSVENHRALLDEAAERGWSVGSQELDVREPDRVRQACEAVVERHGRVDLLVNNAAGNFVCPAERMSSNAWRAVLGIVLDGTFYCCREFGKAMLAQGSGAVLNIVATYVYNGMPGVAHSASAKAGVLALTRSLAAEWAHRGVRLNAIAPGPFETEGASERLWPEEGMRERILSGVPLGRFATAGEIAAHCLHLLSPASGYVTGECFVVDGGSLLGQGMWQTGESIKRRKGPAQGAPSHG